MPPYLVQIEVWKGIWPIVVTVSLLASACCLLPGSKGNRQEVFVIVLAFSMLGIVTGYLTGFSREPAVTAILPAVLSLMGGLLMYLVGQSQENRRIVSISAAIFCFTLLLGTSWGAVMRAESERYRQSEDYLKRKAYIEAEVNDFRKALGLEPLE